MGATEIITTTFHCERNKHQLIINAFTNVFTIDDFEVASDGLHRIKHPNMVFEKLWEICAANEYTYAWDFSSVVVHPATGKVMVAGTLTVMSTTDSAYKVTVPGAATGQTADNDLAGVTTSAFLNACLRGLGMAEFVYAMERAEAPAPAPQRTYAGPPNPNPPQRQQPPQQGTNNGYQNRPRPTGNNGGYNRGGGNGGYQNRGGGYQRGAEPTVGGNGQYSGMKYSELPIEVLQKWASFDEPNKKAVAELNRRMNAGSGDAPDTSYGNNDAYSEEIPF